MTLTFVQRSYQGHVNHCVIFDVEYLGEIKDWFQRIRPPIGNGMWAIEWPGHVTLTLTAQTRDPNSLNVRYLENYLS